MLSAHGGLRACIGSAGSSKKMLTLRKRVVSLHVPRSRRSWMLESLDNAATEPGQVAP